MQQKQITITSNTESHGFIYLLTNQTFPNAIKIGQTTRLPGCRMAELSNTSVPLPFNLSYCRFVEKDLTVIEALIHRKLAKYRINDSREFFALELHDAIQKVDQIIDQHFSL